MRACVISLREKQIQVEHPVKKATLLRLPTEEDPVKRMTTKAS
jgi:hypothetical protein